MLNGIISKIISGSGNSNNDIAPGPRGNFEVTMGIILDNPKIFSKKDLHIAMTGWMGESKANKILNKEEIPVCGVGKVPKLKCTGENECAFFKVCVHTEREPAKLKPVEKIEKVKEISTASLDDMKMDI